MTLNKTTVHKTITDYLTEFNNIINVKSFQPNISATDLKQLAIGLLQDKCPTLDITSPYTNGKAFTVKLQLSEKQNPIDFEIELEFKISVKRSDKLVPVSATRNKYLNYIGKNPVKFSSCNATFYVPTYEWNNSGKLEPHGHTFEYCKVKVKTNDTMQDIINKTAIAATNNFTETMRNHICNPVVKKACLDKNYYNTVNFNQFIMPNGVIKMDKLYDFIITNNMLVTT